MAIKSTTTTTYDCDGYGTTKMIGKTIVETETTPEPIDDGYEVESGVELDGVFEASPLEIFLTATAGALLGNLLYRAIRKN